MKRLLVILLGLCFAVPAFAEGVRSVDNDAWLDHLGQMQIIRQQILSLVTKENPTADDKAVLETLKADFAAQKAKWDNYLVDVSQQQEAPKVDEAKPETQEKAWGSKCKDGDCKGKKKQKKHWKKSCKKCQEGCSGKCGDCKVKDCKVKKAKCNKANKKPCSKGKDCCQVTGKECTDPGCESSKKAVKPCSKSKECSESKCDSDKEAKKASKKCWGRHVCGEQCKNGCKFAKTDCCGSAMCKEVGHCIRDSKKADDCCGGKKCGNKSGECCKTSGKKGCKG